MDPAFTRLASAAGHTLQSTTDRVPPLQKFRSLLSGHELDAYAFAKQMSVGRLKDNEPIFYYMARDIVNRSPTLKKPDLDLAISLVERALFLCVDDILKARMMTLKSEIFQRMGNRQAAQMALINARSQLEPFQKEIKYKAEINKINKRLERYSN